MTTRAIIVALAVARAVIVSRVPTTRAVIVSLPPASRAVITLTEGPAAAAASHLLTEGGDILTTEAGDELVTES